MSFQKIIRYDTEEDPVGETEPTLEEGT